MLRRKLAPKRKSDARDIIPSVTEKAEYSEGKRKIYKYNEKATNIARLEEAVLGVADDVLESLPQRLETKNKQKHKEVIEAPQKKWEDSDDDEDHKDEFEIDNPTWATNVYEEESDDSDEEALKAHTHKVLTASASLPSSSLAFKRVTDANKEDPASSTLTSVQFHPKATVLLAGSADNTLRLFAIDGSKNRKIHSMYLEKTSVKCAKFSRDGSEIIIGSHHKSFYVYDMVGSSGITFRPKMKGLESSKMAEFEVSPDGRFLAFIGTGGYVHLFSQTSKELIDSVKANGQVLSVTFSKDGRFLYAFGEEGELYIWDLNTRDCIHHFSDEGCIRGISLAVSPDSKYIALGSASGIVNIYDHEEALASRNPKPLKNIKNLTTGCKQALFNSQSELLALRSWNQAGGVRLIHFPSMSAFANFPNHLEGDMKKHLSHMDFSPSSGYMAMGTKSGKCLLYRLEHYKQY